MPNRLNRKASSKLQAPSPRDARLQARVAAAKVLPSLPEDPNTDAADAEALSDDAISTDPTRRTIDYGDEILLNPTGKAVDNHGEGDDGNEDINGVNDNEGEDEENGGDDDDVRDDDKEDDNKKEDDVDGLGFILCGSPFDIFT